MLRAGLLFAIALSWTCGETRDGETRGERHEPLAVPQNGPKIDWAKAAWRVKSTMVMGLHKGTYEDVAESTGSVSVSHTPEGVGTEPVDAQRCERTPKDLAEQLDTAVRRWLALAAARPVDVSQEKQLPDSSNCIDCGHGSFQVCAIVPGRPDWCTGDATISLVGYVKGSPAPPIAVALQEVQRAFAAVTAFARKRCFDERSVFTDDNIERYFAYKRELSRELLALRGAHLDELVLVNPKSDRIAIAAGDLATLEGGIERGPLGPRLTAARKTALDKVGLTEQAMRLLYQGQQHFCAKRELQNLEWMCSPEGQKALHTTPCGPGPRARELRDAIATGRSSFASTFGSVAAAALYRHESGFLQVLKDWQMCGCVSTATGNVCAP
jgi:hypothetical protein